MLFGSLHQLPLILNESDIPLLSLNFPMRDFNIFHIGSAPIEMRILIVMKYTDIHVYSQIDIPHRLRGLVG